MADTFTLTDSLSLDDLHTFLGRATAVDDGATRLIASGGILAVYVGVLSPVGLLDTVPTVLGLRTFALTGAATAAGAVAPDTTAPAATDFDVVIPIRALQDRLVRLQNSGADLGAPVTVPLPPVTATAAWAAISPPRGGWEFQSEIELELLELAARTGMDDVAQAVPTAAGDQLVHKIRDTVWSRPLTESVSLPAGAAFAALVLGFLGPGETPRIFESATWSRLSTSRGYVVVKQRTRQ